MSTALALSAIDHVFTGAGAYPLEFVFAYAGFVEPVRLRESLRAAIALFPPVGSRLVPHDRESWALEPSDDGWAFETATHDEPFARTARRSVFVLPVETLPGEPLARVRLTRTPDGSVLGVSLSHAVVDGFSYFYFLSAWSRLFRGETVVPPCHERERLAGDPARAPADPSADLVRERAGLFLDAPRRAAARDRLTWTRRIFARAELHTLHAEAQAQCPVRLSYNDIVAAWLCREHLSRWTARAEPCAWLNCPVDLRRVLPGFPPTYFGCAVSLASVALERAALEDVPLAALARRVRDAVRCVDAAQAQDALATLATLRRREGRAVLERLHVVHPRAGLLVTNLSRLPVAEVVFDAGPPVAFDILAPAERCAVVLPAEDGLDVRVCAPSGAE